MSRETLMMRHPDGTTVRLELPAPAERCGLVCGAMGRLGFEGVWDASPAEETQAAVTEQARGAMEALVAAFERGEKLTWAGHCVVTDPDTPSTVQMVLDHDDFTALRRMIS